MSSSNCQMWLLELFPQGVGKPREGLFLIQEGKAAIGRSASADLPFAEDMSISRNHAQFEVEKDASSNRTLAICDAGSRYGTEIDGKKMEANSKLYLRNSQHKIRFGANQGIIMVQIVNFRFCFSQLDKPEKEALKSLCIRLNAQLAATADVATHLVTKTLTATIKSLTAIALNLPIVSMDWVRAIPSTLPLFYKFPDESQFRPPLGPKVDLQDVNLSRRSLFSHLNVLLLHAADEQYLNVLALCGATVTPLNKTPESDWATTVGTLLATSQTLCVFFDESRGAEYPSDIGPFFTSLSPRIHWFTARALATAILTAAAPQILAFFPVQWNRFTAGASQSQLLSYLPAPSQASLNVTNVSNNVNNNNSTLHASAVSSNGELENNNNNGSDNIKNIATKDIPPPSVPVKRPFSVIVKTEKLQEKVNNEDDLFFGDSLNNQSNISAIRKEVDKTSASDLMPPPSKKIKPNVPAVKDEWDDEEDNQINSSHTSKKRRTAASTKSKSSLVYSTTSATNNEGGTVSAGGLFSDVSNITNDTSHNNDHSSKYQSVTIDSSKLLMEVATVETNRDKGLLAADEHHDEDEDARSISSVNSKNSRNKKPAVAVSNTRTTRKRGQTALQSINEEEPSAMEKIEETPLVIARKEQVETTPVRASKRARKSPAVEEMDNNTTGCFNSKRVSNNMKESNLLDAILEDVEDEMFDKNNVKKGQSDDNNSNKDDQSIVSDFSTFAKAPRRNTKASTKNTQQTIEDWLSVEHSAASQSQLLPQKPKQPAELTRSFSVVDSSKTSSINIKAEKENTHDNKDQYQENHPIAEETDDVVYIVAETIERDLLLLPSTKSNSARSNNDNSHSNNSNSSSSSSTATQLKNVKKFQKNFVRRTADHAVISSAQMQRVLPKETEREIQMRMELEQLARDEAAAQELFLERMTGQATLGKRR